MLCRRTVLLVLATAAISWRPSVGDEPKEDAFAKLKGVWIADEVRSSGTKIAKEKFPFELHFEDEKLIFKFVGAVKGKDRVHDLKLDGNREPFKMDMTRSIRDKESTVYAIYKLDGDRLMILSLRDEKGQPGGERPTSFDSDATAKGELLILKRKS
jgi:uncharacterized protein (TIGR03067 family)